MINATVGDRRYNAGEWGRVYILTGKLKTETLKALQR
jgi:hypothetical protein